jgi:hypothetical protein
MSHGVYACTGCGEVHRPCHCVGPHHKIPNGLCKACQAGGKAAIPKAFQDIERLADYLMVNHQADIIGQGESAVDMAIRILSRYKAAPALAGNSVGGHERMPGRPEGMRR